MKTKVLFLSLLLCCTVVVTAQNSDKLREFYVGTNPLSYLLSFQIDEEFNRFGPIISGNEYGFNICGGYQVKPKLQTELRFSIGNIHQYARVTQLHIGLNYFVGKKNFENQNYGFYGGVFLKTWNYHNRLTETNFYNMSPYITLGYKWSIRRVFIDLRMNQNVMVVSATNLDNTKPGMSWFFSPWPELIPVLPTVNLSVGVKL